MKCKLFLLSVLIFALFAQESNAQNTTPTQQVPVKTQTAPVKAPIKKWKPRLKTQLPVTAQQTPTTTTAAPNTIDTVKNTDNSLNGQYQFLLSRSRGINGYKLVNPFRLTAVWKSVTDTLTKERGELIKTKTKISEQEKLISSLQTQVKGNENEVIDTNTKLDEIDFLGITFTKGTYNIIVWSIILILAAALIIVIARSGKNILEAKHRTQLYDEITAEYQAFKSKSNEQQRKLARELQDERNIVEELKSKKKS